MPEAALALEMRKIGKRFAGVRALDNVSLDVRPGEVLALIGENGAGKSTLMKILGGVHQPDSGEILMGGKTVIIRNVKDSARNGIAFIHQELNVVDNLDVAGNVYLGREPLKGGPLKLLNRAKMDVDTQVYLSRLGLALSPRTPLTALSIAQQQMVEIAKALSLDARILIMDEPTSSLTLTETEKLIAVVRELRAQGVSVIYISHRLGEVIELADRVVVLRDGQNAGALDRSEITHDKMVRLMVGRDIDFYYNPEGRAGDRVRLSVAGLRTRRYPKHELTFDLRAGEILGMAGLVGAGRSEAAQAIFGVDTAVAGTLTLDGQPITVHSAKDAIRHGIYLAPEDRRKSGLIVDMSIRHNITLASLSRYATAGLVNGGRECAAASAAAQSLGVRAPSIEFMARNLSGGNQQKVVLAKWLSIGPKVLIFDEPTRGIDVGAKAEIYALMRNLARDGVAILMISSDMEEVLGQSDRVAVMHEGRLTGILPRAQATEEAVMRLAVGRQTESV